MNTTTRQSLAGAVALLLALGLALSLAGTSWARTESNQGSSMAPGNAPQRLRARSILRTTGPTERLVIRITTTGGTVWGKVMVHYYEHHKRFNRVCDRQLCRLNVPRGVVVHLAQTPTNAASWPFQTWRIKILRKGMKPRTVTKQFPAFKLTQNAVVTAVYVLHYATW